jgi:hypothetical protein
MQQLQTNICILFQQQQEKQKKYSCNFSLIFNNIFLIYYLSIYNNYLSDLEKYTCKRN